MAAPATFTLGGFTVDELNGSGRMRLGKKNPTADRIFRTNFEDRIGFSQFMIGGATSFEDNVFVITLGQSFPGYAILVATGADIVPIGAPTNAGGVVTYDKGARVTIKYSVPETSRSADESEEDSILGTEELDFSAELLSINELNIEWKEVPSERTLIPLTILIPSTEHRFTRSELPSIPGDVQDKLGKVNSEIVKLRDGRSVAKEKLLFLGASARRQVLSDDTGTVITRPYEMTMIFKERREEWNKFYRAKTGKFEAIQIKGGAVLKPYELDDLNSLITGAVPG